MRWISCIKNASTPSASFHPTAISRAWHRACVNRRCSYWAWESRKHRVLSSVRATNLSTLIFCTRQTPMPQKARKQNAAGKNKATRLPQNLRGTQQGQFPPKPKILPRPETTVTRKSPRNTNLKSSKRPRLSRSAIPAPSTNPLTRTSTASTSSPWKPSCAKSPKNSAAMTAGSFLRAWEHALPDACQTSTRATSASRSSCLSSSRSASSKAKA